MSELQNFKGVPNDESDLVPYKRRQSLWRRFLSHILPEVYLRKKQADALAQAHVVTKTSEARIKRSEADLAELKVKKAQKEFEDSQSIEATVISEETVQKENHKLADIKDIDSINEEQFIADLNEKIKLAKEMGIKFKVNGEELESIKDVA